MGRNKFIRCEVCMKSVRSDRIKAHREQHKKGAKYPTETCPICQKNMIAWHLKRHEKVHTASLNQILDNVRHDQEAYANTIKTGELVKEALNDKDIDVKSLRKEYAKALAINAGKTHSPHDDFGSLKLWQKDLLKMMKPSQRKIIWITGKKGAEGKTWLQQYIEHQYGAKRVFRCSVDKNAEAILHTLSKMTLALVDVFLFNIPRCFDPSVAPYSVFEAIKDGQAISTKYDSKVLNFVTPNILIVFSNEPPYTTRASKDRWKTYYIVDDKLEKYEKIATAAPIRHTHKYDSTRSMSEANRRFLQAREDNM